MDAALHVLRRTPADVGYTYGDDGTAAPATVERRSTSMIHAGPEGVIAFCLGMAVFCAIMACWCISNSRRIGRELRRQRAFEDRQRQAKRHAHERTTNAPQPR